MRTASMLVYKSPSSGRAEPRLALVRPARAAEFFDVRGLIEMLVDRVRGGVRYGGVQYVALLNEDVQQQLRLKRNALHATAFIGQNQRQQLLQLGDKLDFLPPDHAIPKEWLEDLTLPLPAWPERNMPGALLLAEHAFAGKGTRRARDVIGLTALAIDLDIHKLLQGSLESQDDPLGIAAVAAMGYLNQRGDAAALPHEAIVWERSKGGRPRKPMAHEPAYDRTHPLAGKPLYEAAAGRWKALPTERSEAALCQLRNDRAALSILQCDPYVQAFIARYLLELLDTCGLSPTCVTLSGRGLHLRWRLSEWVPANAAPRWELMQRMLHWLLRWAGSDPNVSTDRARAFRVPGTMNARSGTRSQRYRAVPGSPFADVLRDPWLFEDLADVLFSKTRHECRALMDAWRERKARQAQLALEQGPDRLVRNTAAGMRVMNRRRLEALKSLALARGGVVEGYRQTFLWMTSCLIRSALPPQVRHKVFDDYVCCLAKPLPAREVRQLHARLNAPNEPRNYRISNRLICETLAITQEELQQFPALSPAEPDVGTWKRVSRQEALKALLQAGIATRIIEKIMQYKPGTVHVLTSRLYAKGVLSKARLRLARLRWQAAAKSPSQRSISFLTWRRITYAVAGVGLDLMRLIANAVQVPRSPPIVADDKRLQKVLERVTKALANSMEQAVGLMERRNATSYSHS